MVMGVKGDLKEEIYNVVNENVRALERLFPSAVKDGQVDFQALKEELGQFEEVGPEKYSLTWSGKQNAKKIAQQDISGKTLKYVPEDSKNPDTTENLYIEGDNLEVLKLLRQNYYGAIKMIYIDPPYNTGNDFVYNDYFIMDESQSDIEEGNISELGERYTVNSKSSNKYHAKWLNMMYPRLKVAKDLLTDDGVIFISIDDSEVSNLKKVCDEIFGECNFVGCISRATGTTTGQDANKIGSSIDYCVVYSKSVEFDLMGVPLDEKDMKRFNEIDEKGRYSTLQLRKTGNSDRKEDRPNMFYAVIAPDGSSVYPFGPSEYLSRWRVGKDTFQKLKEENMIVWKKNESLNNIKIGEYTQSKWIPYVKYYLEGRTKQVSNLIQDIEGNKKGSLVLKELLEQKGIFDNPKPIQFIEILLQIAMKKDDIILDFFSGSSTTAHTLLKLNSEDNGKRKFIMVQIPEKTSIKSEAYKAGYKNICEIGKERIRRAGEKIKEENKDKEGIENLDIGFKVFRVSDTNIRWNYENEDLRTLSKISVNNNEEQTTFDYIAATTMEDNLDGAISPKDKLDFMPGTKDIDVVYEILLRQRDIPLSAKVELLEDIGKRTYIFADSYVVCLETEITEELIEKLAAINPLPIKYILRDSAFGDDIELKDLSYRRLQALIERNTGESKKAYTVEFI